MTQLRKTLTVLLTSVFLFVGILFSTSDYSLAAITPSEAKTIIQESSSPQEAGAKLRASDSSDKLRNRETLDTAKEVRERVEAGKPDRRDPLVSNTQNKFEEIAENVKEKLNLDEPISQSTKDFGNDIKGKANEVLGNSND
ncbi:MAG: hypothetical protein KME13_13205 [Myxacorys californica WJT36-NPBG1]|jgi:biopolymer transport protein ExbB/TolQ|nr:hypothetical protein [Myxacorys californica WJT36-NPBG1]